MHSCVITYLKVLTKEKIMEMKLNNKLFVLDTETGGLDANNHSLMEVAGVIIQGDKIIDTYSSIVKSPTGKYVWQRFC